MTSEHLLDVKFEIGHVLFVDIVGYSKLLITEQSGHLRTLKEIVRGTEQFRSAEAEGKLLRLPPGDGMALVFRTNPEAPVLCALEISKALQSHGATLSRQFGEGLLARAMHDEARARKAFTAARMEHEEVMQKQKDYAPALCFLGLIDAALGNKEAALQEGRRAMELEPVEKDSFTAQSLMAYFALIAAWVGEKDLALQQLAAAAPTPGASLIASYGMLKLSPFWDPLRGDPRFERIVASFAPKE